jgi:hypothetical protein
MRVMRTKLLLVTTTFHGGWPGPSAPNGPMRTWLISPLFHEGAQNLWPPPPTCIAYIAL